MLTEILIKPFIKDLEHQGIEDTTPYEQGFLAGMTALSSILSDNIDNKAQLFTYLGMAISEGMQWVESQVSESPKKAPVFPGTNEFIPQLHDPRWVEPNDDFVGFDCYGLAAFNGVCKGVLNRTAEGTFYIYQYGGYEFGVNKVIPLESRPRKRQPTPSSAANEIVSTEVYTLEEFKEKFQPTPSTDVKENDWDYIPVHDDLPASLIQKYAKKNVWFTTPDNPGPEKPGRAILDLSSNRLQIIETNGNQVKRPYYIQLR